MYEDDGYETKWSIPNAGQAKFGGWDPEGIKLFVKLKKANTEARKTDQSKEWEQQVLDTLRAKYKCKADSWEQEESNKKAKTSKTIPESAEIDDLFGDEE